MVTSLIGLLEEKGIITHDEWEEKIKQRIEGRSPESIRDLEDESQYSLMKFTIGQKVSQVFPHVTISFKQSRVHSPFLTS